MGETIDSTREREIDIKAVLYVPVCLKSFKNGYTRDSKSAIVAKCQLENGVYKFSGIEYACLMKKNKTSAFLWHKRLGHINYQYMKKIRDGFADGMCFDNDIAEIENCETCAKAKQTIK